MRKKARAANEIKWHFEEAFHKCICFGSSRRDLLIRSEPICDYLETVCK